MQKDPPTPRIHPPHSSTLSQEPQRKSAAAHRGNPVLPGVPAQPGTICLGAMTQEQRCQGGFPLTCRTPRAVRARPGTGDRSIICRGGSLCAIEELDVKLSERAERHGGETKVNDVKLKRHTGQHTNIPGNCVVAFLAVFLEVIRNKLVKHPI